MADNTDDEHLYPPINSPSEDPSDDIVLIKETETINTNQAPENMEVHHHAHHGDRKNWKSYFWEFLMLFLAVFAGFLAENQREHFVEHQREKKFARRLLSDLEQDSTYLETRIRLLEERQRAHTRFLVIMSKPVPAADWEVMRAFVPLITTGSSHDFTTATYNQMKTSGSLRYIDNDSLTTSLQKYYDVLVAKVSRDSDGADKFFAENIIAYMTKHFRFQDFKQSDGPVQQTKLLNRSTDSDQELINIMGVWASNCDAQLELHRPAQKQMLALIKLIKKEYHLE